MRDPWIRTIEASSQHTLILRRNGELLALGRNSKGCIGVEGVDWVHKPILVLKDDDLRHVYCGTKHSLLLKKNGQVLGFGYSKLGQLGKKEGNEETSLPCTLQLGSRVTMLMGDHECPLSWSVENHREFDLYTRYIVFFFLLLIKRIPIRQRPPRFVSYLIINYFV